MSIIDLPDGETVTKSGFYRTSLAHYHSQTICPGPSLSSSGLRRVIAESPFAFWKFSDLNPERYAESNDSAAMALGRGAHCLMLGDEVFDAGYIYVPADAPQRPTEPQIKARDEGRITDAAAKRFDFWDAFDARAEGRTMLTADQVEKIGRMAGNMKLSRECTEALQGDLMEVSLIWQDRDTGIWLKARPDMIPEKHYDFSDLKTIAPQNPDFRRAIDKSIRERGYHMQFGLSAMGFKALTGEAVRSCALVFTQTTKAHECACVSLDADAIYWGQVQMRHAINIVARCMEDRHWPMQIDGILNYALPEHEITRLSEKQANGELPNMTFGD